MKQVIINILSLHNFKGIKELSIDFGMQTDILGANGTGKTTIYDAWLWLMTGRDSSGRADFEIKTLDNGVAIQKIEHSVKCKLSIDGVQYVLEKKLVETWETPKGEAIERFKGNNIKYLVNGTPLSEGDYNRKMNDLLNIDDTKILFNASGFTSLNWKEQRSVLFSMSPLTDDDLFSRGDFDFLKSRLTNKTIDELKKELKASKSEAKKALSSIPSRINEVRIATPKSLDYGALEQQKLEINQKLFHIDDVLSSAFKYNEAARAESNRKIQQIAALQDKANKFKSDYIEMLRAEAHKKNAGIRELQETLTKHSLAKEEITLKAASCQRDIDAKEKEIEQLRNAFVDISNQTITIDENSLICPTCKRPLDNIAERKNELISSFNSNKSHELMKLNEQGKKLKSELSNLKLNLITFTDTIEEINFAIKELEVELSNSPQHEITEEIDFSTVVDYCCIQSEISKLEAELNTVQSTDNDKILEDKSRLSSELDHIKTELNTKALIVQSNQRIKEIEAESNSLSQEVANIERLEEMISDFTRVKINTIETDINQHFEHVKFKLFDYTIDGKEIDTCVATIDGVPISDLNNASKIHANMDISVSIGKFYDLMLPVFVDNAESVNHINQINNQVIRLVVTKDKELSAQILQK